jgi:DnaJ-class molecular chaperone
MSESEREPRSCVTCDGKGSVYLARCVPCNGHGQVLVYKPFVKCPHCRGDGKHQAGDPFGAKYCGVCQGRGWALSIAILEEPQSSGGGE